MERGKSEIEHTGEGWNQGAGTKVNESEGKGTEWNEGVTGWKRKREITPAGREGWRWSGSGMKGKVIIKIEWKRERKDVNEKRNIERKGREREYRIVIQTEKEEQN